MSVFRSGYGLRDNPKKTWRVCGPASPIEGVEAPPKPAEADVELGESGASCKECGRSFKSWPAVYGHMRSHDSPAGACRKRRRRRTCGGGFGESEVEKVAITLMMLSRDGLESPAGGYHGRSSVFVVRNANHESRFSDCDDGYFVDGGVRWCAVNSNDWFDRDEELIGCDNDKMGLNRVYDDKLVLNRVKMQSESVCDEAIYEAALMKKLKCESELDAGAGIEIEIEKKKNNVELKTKMYYCVTCNKGFATYQGLGGHRGGHKKANKVCAPKGEGIVDDALGNVGYSLGLGSAGGGSRGAHRNATVVSAPKVEGIEGGSRGVHRNAKVVSAPKTERIEADSNNANGNANLVFAQTIERTEDDGGGARKNANGICDSTAERIEDGSLDNVDLSLRLSMTGDRIGAHENGNVGYAPKVEKIEDYSSGNVDLSLRLSISGDHRNAPKNFKNICYPKIGRVDDDILENVGFSSWFSTAGDYIRSHKNDTIACAPTIGKFEDVDWPWWLSSAGVTTVKTQEAEKLMKCVARVESSRVKMVREEGYKCHVCFKVCATRQGLGGHVRWCRSPNGRKIGVVLESGKAGFLDLNIPASSETFLHQVSN